MYSYCYVCSVLCILLHFVVLCIVGVYMCAILLPPVVNPISVNKYIISQLYFYVTVAMETSNSTDKIKMIIRVKLHCRLGTELKHVQFD